MSDPTIEQEILEQVTRLQPDEQLRVLDFAKALAGPLPQGTTGKQFLKFVGSIPAEDLKEMQAAIRDGCEKVDANGSMRMGGSAVSHADRVLSEPRP